uniref:Uncharacterized protein n=1 Tax=Lepeophtheirus salmonis TaxID=72036 RepID=A0A0K2V726_LEPSM
MCLLVSVSNPQKEQLLFVASETDLFRNNEELNIRPGTIFWSSPGMDSSYLFLANIHKLSPNIRQVFLFASKISSANVKI